jgi:hypothetical protein
LVGCGFDRQTGALTPSTSAAAQACTRIATCMGCQTSRLIRSPSADNTAEAQPQAAPAPDTSAPAPVDKSATTQATGTVEAVSTMSNKSEAGTSAAPVCPSEADDETPGDIAAPPSGAPKLANEHRWVLYKSKQLQSRSATCSPADFGAQQPAENITCPSGCSWCAACILHNPGHGMPVCGTAGTRQYETPGVSSSNRSRSSCTPR